MKKKPILVIIPHGGTEAPEELAGLVALNRFDLLFESDACANELFRFGDRVAATVDADVSRLFVDLDRPHLALPPASGDGVIKKLTSQMKPVFRDGAFPDEIAIANLVERYYLPFHRAVDRMVRSGEIRCVIECHTMKAVASPSAPDAGTPRPLVTVGTLAGKGSDFAGTCPDGLGRRLIENIGSEFAGEDATVAERFTLNRPLFCGALQEKYGLLGVPYLRIAVSRSLFFNDRHFNLEFLSFDELRLRDLRERLWSAVKKSLP